MTKHFLKHCKVHNIVFKHVQGKGGICFFMDKWLCAYMDARMDEWMDG